MTEEAATQVAEAATPAQPKSYEFKTTEVPSEVPKAEEPKPVEPAVPAEQEKPADAQAAPDDPDGEAEDSQPEKAPLPKGVQRKINKLTRKAGELAIRNSELEERLASYESAGQVQQKPTEQVPEGEPTLEQFDFDQAAFNRAHFQWMRGQEKAMEAAQSRAKTLQERESAFAAEHPDYMELTRSEDWQVTPVMAQIIADSDAAPAIAYYLASNPGETSALAQMHPAAMARAIGRIEAKLESSTPQKPELPKKTTNAPPPPKTVSGGGSPAPDVDDPNLTTEQRIALWKKAKGKR